MRGATGRTVAGIVVAAAAIGSLVVVAIPAWVIYPFRPQTGAGLALSYDLKRIAPTATVGALVAVTALAAWLWSRAGRLSRGALAGALLAAGAATWFARQNHFEWMFHPVPAPQFAEAARAPWVKPGDRVLSVALGGDSAAYPIRLLAYHHLLHDTVGGTPVVVTY